MKKTIGICLTKIHDRTRSEFVDHLFRYAKSMDYKPVVFNSFIEFSRKTEYLSGSASVYESIHYDLLDALVILNDNFYDKNILDRIIANAKASNIPVIIINGKCDGCYSINVNYTAAYKELIRHVIREHGARKTFFIAGRKGDDRHSIMRISCYKEVLAEEGLEVSDDNIDYGEYWDLPTIKIIDRLAETNSVPDAVFCANDVMAMTACERLSMYGYKVPDDVIVTGFDGLPQAEFFSPSISTCREDLKGLAEKTISLIGKIFDQTVSETEYTNDFAVHIAESCGCRCESIKSDRTETSELFSLISEMSAHEDYIFKMLDSMLNKPSLSQALKIISYLVLGGSYLFLDNKNLKPLADIFAENREYKGDYTVITHSDSWDTESDPCRFLTYEDVKLMVRSGSNNSIIVINPIFVGSTVFGYYGVIIDDIMTYAHKIKRITKAINIAFNEMYNRMKQAEMRLKAEKAAYTNQVTGLPNLRGSCKWFNDFSASEENRKKHISISVYALAKYKYILENYGIADVENCIIFMGEALKSSNPHNCFIGQISENEFVIINYYEENEDISKVINSATSNFFPLMEDFNRTNGKDYFAEVNCGCTVVNPGWNGTLASFIKFASAELYMNKLRMNTERIKGPESKDAVDNEKFALLIEQNMFRYCFQPIVDAKTGEIFAHEALMRTTDSINMSPLEVLHAAALNNRLYDIERATVFNIMEHYAHNSDVFGKCKVFINLIPGYFLNETDYKIIGAKYGSMMDNFVFEITEQNTVSDSELERIKKLGGEYRSNPVAVDDYGTGHSNIVNLLRYSPQIIKIDRFLISGCDTDVNKQMFIKSTVEFARLNGIKVLAEGVETSEELKTTVSFGVDYIQGYYTGKPVFDPIPEIKDTIREEILDINNSITE